MVLVTLNSRERDEEEKVDLKDPFAFDSCAVFAIGCSRDL